MPLPRCLRLLLGGGLALALTVGAAVPAPAQMTGPFDFSFLGLGAGLVTPATGDVAATASPVTPATSPLTGRVVDATGQPVPGAAVELLHAGRGTVAEDTTDSQGRFFLYPVSGLDSLYRVRVWAKGFYLAETAWTGLWDTAWQELTLRPLGGWVQGRAMNGLAPVAGAVVRFLGVRGEVVDQARSGPDGRFTLGLPARTYTVQVLAPDFLPWSGALPVTDGGTAFLVADLARATARVRGVVVDAITGQPLPGARVELVRTGYGVVQSRETDGQGRFDFATRGTDSTEYRLRVWALAHALKVTAAFAAAPGATVEYLAGESIALAPAHATVLGALVDENGAPVRDAEVRLDLKGVGTVARVTTDAAGAFRFLGVAAGGTAQYRVRAVPWLKRVADSGWFTPAGGEVRNLTFMAAQAAIASANTYGLIFGRVADATGSPLDGVAVTVEREAHRTVARAVTGPDGTFRLLVWATGGGPPYLVRAEKDGYLPSDQIAGSTTDTVAVTANGMVQVNITLHKTTVDLQGRVLTADGVPAAAEVVLYRQGAGAVLRTGTDALGQYRFPGLERGTGPSLLVQASGSAGTGDTGGADAATLVDPGVALGLLPTISLAAATTSLTGRVTDHRQQPVGGAEVTLAGSDGPGTGRTSPDGTFTFDGLAVGAQIVLTVSDRNRIPAAAAAVTLARTNAPLSIMLRPVGAEINGRVADRLGHSLPGVRVELLQEGQGVVAHSTTDTAGRYQFAAVPVQGGLYTLRVRSESHGVSSQTDVLGGLMPLFPAVAGSVWDIVLPGAP